MEEEGREREPSDRQRRLLICLRWQLEMPPNNYKVAYSEGEIGKEREKEIGGVMERESERGDKEDGREEVQTTAEQNMV